MSHRARTASLDSARRTAATASAPGDQAAALCLVCTGSPVRESVLMPPLNRSSPIDLTHMGPVC